jgi:ketosteroid isomerase-like protein
MTRPLTVACVGLLLVSACAPASEPPAAPDDAVDRAAIEAIYQAENRAIEAGDFGPMRQFMAANLTIMPPDAPAVSGESAAQAWIDDFVAAATVKLQDIRSGTLVVSGDLAVYPYSAVMIITPRDGSAPMSEDAKGIHVFQRDADGSWKLTHDVWNANAP